MPVRFKRITIFREAKGQTILFYRERESSFESSDVFWQTGAIETVSGDGGGRRFHPCLAFYSARREPHRGHFSMNDFA
jgi:hypothetical protein